MAPNRYIRSLLGAAAVGLVAAAFTGCQLLPEESLAAKHFKESKLRMHVKESKITKHLTQSKFAKILHESLLVKLHKPKEPEIPVMPEIVPPEKTPPPQSALNLAPGAPPPGPPTVWAKLGLSPEQREYRKRMLAETPAGKLLAAAGKPLTKLTGGLIPPLKPPKPTLAMLLDKGAIGAASKVKMDKMNAKARKVAVEELKDVDCHYWPEAEDALIAALRTDRNEAVRYTAAKTLAGGKCCTKKTIEALIISTSGSDRDGAPCEVSATVRAMAAKALEKCLTTECLNRCGVQYLAVPCPEVGPPEEKPREEEQPRTPVVPASVKPGPYPPGEANEEEARHTRMVSYYEKARKKSVDTIAATGRDVLARVSFPPDADAIPAGHPDYEAVDLFPEPPAPPPSASPRPEGLFDRPKPAPPEKDKEKTAPAPPRDPSRPVNILDLLSPAEPPAPAPPAPATPKPAPPPTTGPRIEEPPRAPPGPIRPASVMEERNR